MFTASDSLIHDLSTSLIIMCPLHTIKKLRQVLSEMEEKGIGKFVSEYASPLILVWKKDL